MAEEIIDETELQQIRNIYDQIIDNNDWKGYVTLLLTSDNLSEEERSIYQYCYNNNIVPDYNSPEYALLKTIENAKKHEKNTYVLDYCLNNCPGKFNLYEKNDILLMFASSFSIVLCLFILFELFYCERKNKTFNMIKKSAVPLSRVYYSKYFVYLIYSTFFSLLNYLLSLSLFTIFDREIFNHYFFVRINQKVILLDFWKYYPMVALSYFFFISIIGFFITCIRHQSLRNR